MITIFKAANITEAGLIRGLLESHGIEAHITGAFLTGGIGELPVGDYIRVRVPSEDQEQARRILDDYQSGRLALDEDELPEAGPEGQGEFEA